MPKAGDLAILDIISRTLDGVAAAFGSNCEVVLHSLDDLGNSVVRIINGHVTGRSVGSPLTYLGIEILEKARLEKTDVIGPYFTRLDDGRELRSVTTIIRDPEGKIVGMLCINIDISTPAADFFRDFLHLGAVVPEIPAEHFSVTSGEMISKVLASVMEKIGRQSRISPTDRNKIMVDELYIRGIFNVRGAVDMVAEELGVSRGTIYNYLRGSKTGNKLPESESIR